MLPEPTVDEAIEEAQAKVEKALENKRIYEPIFELACNARCAMAVPQRPTGGPTEIVALQALIQLARERLEEIQPSLGLTGYQMKDLGYERTPCPAYLQFSASGQTFAFPAQVVVDDRDQYYSDDKEDTWGSVHCNKLSAYEIQDWAINNMNWSAVSQWARLIASEPVNALMEKAWCQADSLKMYYPTVAAGGL